AGDRLVAEINAFDCLERATEWAQRSIAEKNRLLPADARRVEGAFQARLERLSASTSDAVPQRNAARSRRAKGVDKSALTLSEPRRVRDREHLRLVAQKVVSFADGNRRIRTIFALRRAARWDKRS